jgi:osmotically-inducible protein OsmY
VAGTPVVASDGPVGSLTGVGRDPATGAVAHLLVRRARLFGLLADTRLVPAAWVKDATADGVILTADRAAVAACPPGRPDAELQADVLEALDRVDLPRYFRSRVHVVVRDGVVDLSGHVRSAAHARLLAERAGAVPGVLGVRDGLVDDEALVPRVAQALTADPDVGRAVLRVDSRLGEVSLAGELPSAARRTATELAAVVPGVRTVQDHTAERPAAVRPAG